MLVDAIHVATGKAVYIKEVATDSEELHIAQLLTQEGWVSDPRNHCVPVAKVFQDHENPNLSYIVMPLLRPVDTPPFETVREIIKFTDQILEVIMDSFATLLLTQTSPGLGIPPRKGSGTPVWLSVLHTHTHPLPAHRDCVQRNLMMDADAMYPDGFHPVSLDHTPDYSGFAKHTSRTAAKVKYYFIDFGISVHVPEDLRPKLFTGFLGRDRDPPELSRTVPYDPFKLDIFIIGNMLKREFQEVSSFSGPDLTSN